MITSNKKHCLFKRKHNYYINKISYKKVKTLDQSSMFSPNSKMQDKKINKITVEYQYLLKILPGK